MKLELKHLAPYLPYGLKIEHPTFQSGKRKISELTSIKSNSVETEHRVYCQIANCKPILRPLSDIDKELSFDGKFGFIPSKRLSDEYLNFSYWGENTIGKGILNEKHKMINLCFIANEIVGECPLAIYEQLLEWHFDVFGLIPAGLAISIHDVKQVIA